MLYIIYCFFISLVPNEYWCFLTVSLKSVKKCIFMLENKQLHKKELPNRVLF